MSLSNIGLTGINAASTALSIAGNNIVNTETNGFKSSRVSFSDIFLSAGGSLKAGEGVNIASITQDFASASTTGTGRDLDFALSDVGFFVAQSVTGDSLYTRAGSFERDKDGNLKVVGASDQSVQGYNFDQTAGYGALAPISLNPASTLAATASTAITYNFNLDAKEAKFTVADPDDATLNPSVTTNFSHQIPTPVFDSLGAAHTLSFYFERYSNTDWNVYTQLDGTIPSSSSLSPVASITFASDGTIGSVNTSGNYSGNSSGTTITLPTFSASALANGAADLDLSVNLSAITMFASENTLGTPTVDGNAAGVFTKFETDDTGVVSANYSNGQSLVLAQLAVATFTNPNALQQNGNNTWTSNTSSGEAIIQNAGDQPASSIIPGQLEDSNSDLTSELVNMISLQQFFSANARIIQTDNQLSQTILQIR